MWCSQPPLDLQDILDMSMEPDCGSQTPEPDRGSHTPEPDRDSHTLEPDCGSHTPEPDRDSCFTERQSSNVGSQPPLGLQDTLYVQL